MTKERGASKEVVVTASSKSLGPSTTTEIDLDLGTVASPVLARLIDEVKNEAAVDRSYNRTYHRHNR